MKTCFAFLSLLLCGGLSLQGQEDQPPAPTPPFVGVLTRDLTLVKTYTYAAPEQKFTPEEEAAREFLAPTATKLKEVTIVKRGGLRKDTQLFMDGKGKEIWRWQNYRFTFFLDRPNSVDIDIAAGTYNPELPNQYIDLPEFPELDWVQAGAYKGIQNQQGKPCYFYKAGDQSAWIEIDSKLPLLLESKNVRISYLYSPPPGQPLQLPRGFAEKLEKYKRSLRGQL